MAAKKNEAVSDDGFRKLDTIDSAAEYEKSEWVEPAAGTLCEGKLERAFLVPDDLADKPGQFRACFTYRDHKGDLWNFGEKAAFKGAIRALRQGTTFSLTFKSKDRTPAGKPVWRVDFKAKDDGAGPTMLDMLKADFAQKKAQGEDLPF